MLKTYLKIFLAFTLVLAIVACSGSRSSTSETPPFADEQLQKQVDDLLDKIDDNPQNVEYRLQLAELYQQNDRGADGLKVLEDGLKLDPNDAELKYAYANLANDLGDRRKAYTAYKEILQGSSGNDYLDRIAPKFVDIFKVTKVVGTPANEAFGSFSADGDKIIYQSDQDSTWDIYEYTISTQTTEKLIGTPAQEEAPVFNPNGHEIAYTSTEEDHRNVDFNMKVRDIYVYDIDTKKTKNVTMNSSDDWHPKYSNDGKLIAFVSERDDLRDVDFDKLTGEIYYMESDGRFQLRVTNNTFNDGGAVLAPGSTEDNGTIFYDSDETGNYEIYKTDLKGEKKTQITFDKQSNEVDPDISPSGDKIAFFSDRDGNYEIYMMNSDGSAEMRLTANPADDLNPVFSPDGKKILFHSNRAGNYDLYMIDLSQQNSTPAVLDVISSIDQALQSLQ